MHTVAAMSLPSQEVYHSGRVRRAVPAARDRDIGRRYSRRMSGRPPGDLPSGDALRALAARRDAPGLRRLAAHVALLGATGAGVLAAEGVWLMPAMLAHGAVLSFLFCPLHEAVHETAFRRRWLSRSVARAIGVLLLLPARWFRLYHLAHHRFTQDPDRDPELAGAVPLGLGGYLLRVSGLPYWRDAVAGLLRHAAGAVDARFVPPRERPAIVREARAHVAVYAAVAAASIAAGSPLALLLWVGPALLGQPALRLVLLAEHTGCPRVARMLENTRTTLTAAPVRFLTWNMSFHAEHHAHPGVPFHALPRLHARLAGGHGVLCRGYRRFHGGLLRRLAAGARVG